MERTVITKREAAAPHPPRGEAPRIPFGGGRAASAEDASPAEGRAAAPRPDDYKDRLFKYIPADVIALYLTLNGIVASTGADDGVPLDALGWVILAVVLAGTPVYLWRVAKIRKRKQIVISTAAFLVWAFYLGGPFRSLPFYHPVYAAILFPLFTFLIPIVEVEE